VYGERGPAPLAETLDTRPLAPYGHHKLEAEELLRSAAIDAVVIRYFSLYGNGLRKQLFWDLARRILAAGRGEAIPMLGTGDETRDFMHVEDAARLALHLYRQKERRFLLVNGATGRATSIRSAATLLCEALGRENPLCFTGEPARGAPTHLAADVTRLQELGFRSRTALEDGIARYASWVAREIGSHA
jgi:UDP-glucose 4-epimerase